MPDESPLSVGSYDGGYSGGYNGGYYGGEVDSPETVHLKAAFREFKAAGALRITGVVIVLILIYMGLSLFYTWAKGMIDKTTKFQNNPGANLRFESVVSKFQNGKYPGGKSGFMNSREEPYFPDVSNRVLGMENREKEAIRALGKINQTRLQRSPDGSPPLAPLPWDPFWKEWQAAHPSEDDILDGDVEGFNNLSSAVGMYN